MLYIIIFTHAIITVQTVRPNYGFFQFCKLRRDVIAKSGALFTQMRIDRRHDIYQPRFVISLKNGYFIGSLARQADKNGTRIEISLRQIEI